MIGFRYLEPLHFAFRYGIVQTTPNPIPCVLRFVCSNLSHYNIVQMKMKGQDATREISMGKLLSGQLMNKVAGGCLQMHGGMGFMSEMRVSRFFRDAKLISIGGGASEVMCEIISKTSGL